MPKTGDDVMTGQPEPDRSILDLIEHPKRLWAIQTRTETGAESWSYTGLKATADDCAARGLAVVEYAPSTTPGAVDLIRDLREAAIYAVGARSECDERERWDKAVRQADILLAEGR